MRAVFRTQSGIEFQYDNQTNGIYEMDGRQIALPGSTLNLDQYQQHAEVTYGTRKKSDRPVALRILLGHACNYSCSYCMQKDIGNPSERPARTEADLLVQTIRDTLDLSQLARVELWGGEPFLYWADIQTLIKFFDREGLTFFFSTNGSPLRPKHAEFFGQLKANVTVSISHDATMQQALRGEDVLEHPSVIQTLKLFDELPNVSYLFTCSVMDQNFDLFAINAFFRERIQRHGLQNALLGFSLGRTYQEGPTQPTEDYLPCITHPDGAGDKATAKLSHKFVIQGENLERFRVVLRDFLEQHYQQMVADGFDETGSPLSLHRPAHEMPLLLTGIYEALDGYSVMEYARKVVTGEPILETTNCGADMADILSFDMQGRVRTCPHTGEHHAAGTLNHIKGIRIVGIDLSRKQGGCASCVNRTLCRSGCPIKFNDDVFYTNCRVEKVWYGEIQLAAFRLIFGEPVAFVRTLEEE